MRFRVILLLILAFLASGLSENASAARKRKSKAKHSSKHQGRKKRSKSKKGRRFKRIPFSQRNNPSRHWKGTMKRFNGFNSIENDPYLVNFLTKLDTLESSKTGIISILHVGDSHIQADLFTGTLRRKLQQQFGHAGRGLIFPYRVAGTNEPFDLKSSSDYNWNAKRMVHIEKPQAIGISGITLESVGTDFSLWCETRALEDSFTRVQVFSNGCAIALSDESGKLAINKSPEYEEVKFFQFEQPVRKLKLSSNNGNCKLNLFGLNLLNEHQYGIIYHAAGVNGARVDHLNIAEKWLNQTQALAPDLIIVSLGTNDSNQPEFDKVKFANEIENLCCKIREVHPKAALLFTLPPDFGPGPRKRSRKASAIPADLPAQRAALEVIKAKAASIGFAYWDFRKVMGGPGSRADWVKKGLMQQDRVHLTTTGYALQAEMLYEALLSSLYPDARD